MRTKTTISLLLLVILFVVTDNYLFAQRPQKKRMRKTADSTLVDSTLEQTVADDKEIDKNDTTQMDSLQKAIYHHNRQIDDSIRLDSIQRAKANGIEAPVQYAADDSLIYDAKTKTAYMFGTSKVDYQNMKLNSDKIYMSLDSSIVRATGSPDTTAEDGIKGKPQFSMGTDEYKSDTMAFNFKSKRGLIKDVYTEQEDGYLKGELGKRDSTGTIYLKHGRYTTCDDPHPDFYIALSRAKVRPGKDVVFGPAYLVVADVPLPLAIPYGFFPFSKKYSSGFIMPSYGDEQTRGFYLHNGGYYFAINDKVDLKLLGEIYTKGSWGITATSNYRKRYRYSGSFMASYQDSREGDKGMADYHKTESFKVQWNHTQDQKANPFRTMSASVNFATSSYESNNLTSMYNPQARTQSTRTSSVRWSTGFSSLNMTLDGTFNIAQNMRDTTLDVTLPNLTVNVSRFYPFRRKHMAGKERWYEKISLTYTGELKNSIEKVKENRILKTNFFKEWRNGISHKVPIQADFSLFKYINVKPNITITDRMYSQKVMRGWDKDKQMEVATDTVYGFHNLIDWSMGISASTKIYGFWTPNRKIFGDKIQAIRHVITPTISFSYTPDFSESRYGYYDTYLRTNSDGSVSLVEYSPFANNVFGAPGNQKSESISFGISNNLEMKVKSDKDSTGYKKISLIDKLAINMSYNAAAKRHPWSDINADLVLKWWKSYTFSMHARFAMYAYELDNNGNPFVSDHTEFHFGRFPRFQGLSQNFSFIINPEKIKKWFGGGDDEEEENSNNNEGIDTKMESNIDDKMEQGKHAAKKKGGIAETDRDGYMKFSMPWSLTIGYGITMRENTSGKFDKKHMRYPYTFSHTLNCTGNIRISDGWNIQFASGYDFDAHKLSMTTASLSRDLHCFNMSAFVVLYPYTSYNFTFRCNASTLTDALKYDKNSGFTNAVQWY
ncbi:MAG: LPS-assembly protein LptD [Prevotella sp.]|nr:LPS-assembly protein LptD [Prevotella sp.]